MLDFVKFFVNLFLHLNISFDSKKIASEDCLGKIAFQNTDGQFDDMLAATQAVHDDLFQDVSDIDTSVAVQKALTEITDELMDKFTKRVTKLNLHFESTGFVDSPYYNEFFLHGVQEITKGTNKGNIVTYMNRMINAITAHTTEAGGPSVLTEFQNFKTQYNNARQAQELKKGGTQGKRTTRNEAEVAWAEQMFDNLLTIAKLYKGKPEKVNDFFTQHLFERHYSSDKDHIGTLTGKVLTVIPSLRSLMYVCMWWMAKSTTLSPKQMASSAPSVCRLVFGKCNSANPVSSLRKLPSKSLTMATPPLMFLWKWK